LRFKLRLILLSLMDSQAFCSYSPSNNLLCVVTCPLINLFFKPEFANDFHSSLWSMSETEYSLIWFISDLVWIGFWPIIDLFSLAFWSKIKLFFAFGVVETYLWVLIGFFQLNNIFFFIIFKADFSFGFENLLIDFT